MITTVIIMQMNFMHTMIIIINGNYKTENASAYRRETDDNSPIMLISALMLLVATLLLLSVVAIII